MAITFLAAPAFGVGSFPACCPQPADTPCETAKAPCALANSCCELAPAERATPAKASLEQPTFHPFATALLTSTPVFQQARLRRISADLALRSSPLRLSVVLVI